MAAVKRDDHEVEARDDHRILPAPSVRVERVGGHPAAGVAKVEVFPPEEVRVVRAAAALLAEHRRAREGFGRVWVVRGRVVGRRRGAVLDVGLGGVGGVLRRARRERARRRCESGGSDLNHDNKPQREARPCPDPTWARRRASRDM